MKKLSRQQIITITLVFVLIGFGLYMNYKLKGPQFENFNSKLKGVGAGKKRERRKANIWMEDFFSTDKNRGSASPKDIRRR